MSSSALLPIVRNRIDIDSETRIRLVNAIMEGITIDFFTVMLLCDKVPLTAPIPRMLKFTGRTVLQSLGFSATEFAIGTVNSGVALYNHETFLNKNVPRAVRAGKAIILQGGQIMLNAIGEATGHKIVDTLTGNQSPLSFKYQVMKSALGIMLREITPSLKEIGASVAINAAVIVAMNIIEDPTLLEQRTSSKCTNLWEILLKQQNISTDGLFNKSMYNFFQLNDISGGPEQRYLEERPHVSHLWNIMTNIPSAPTSPTTNVHNDSGVDFNTMLPHLTTFTFINAAALAFNNTPGLGRDFLSYLDLVARFHIPVKYRDDPRSYIVIRTHAEFIIRTLVNSQTHSVDPQTFVAVPNPSTQRTLEDITYALLSGLFNFMIESHKDDSVRKCLTRLAANNFVVSSQWVNLTTDIDFKTHMRVIDPTEDLNCISLMIYANLLMLVPQHIRMATFTNWQTEFMYVNDLVTSQLNSDSGPSFALINQNITMIQRYFIYGSESFQRRDLSPSSRQRLMSNMVLGNRIGTSEF